jgi:hypothetical protein
MNQIINLIILILHFVLLAFIVGTPFAGSNYLLLLHAIIVPFIVSHWVTDNDDCALTIMEQKIRQGVSGGEEVNKKDCLMYGVVGPVYNLRNTFTDQSAILYMIATTLWILGLFKLIGRYQSGQIRSYMDLFR